MKSPSNNQPHKHGTRTRTTAVKLAATTLFASLAAVALSATAAAEPPPPVDPAIPVDPGAPLPPPPGGVTNLGPLGAVPASGYGLDLLLGQYAAPALPGQAPSVGPSPAVLNAGQFLIPQNYRMPGEDQISPYPLQDGVPPGPFARVDALKGMHAVVHGALGRMPIEDLSQPLPGTAPPPGTALPPGPVGNLPDPEMPLPAPELGAVPGLVPAPDLLPPG